jgi:hypothetical protein
LKNRFLIRICARKKIRGQAKGYLAQEEVDEKTNEIKHVKPLLKDINIEGAIVTADALHTQKETAKFLVEEKKAHYLLTVKDNQPTLLEDIKYLDLKKTLKPLKPLKSKPDNQMLALPTKNMGEWKAVESG